MNDFLKRATGAGALFAANDYNFGIRPANILPVGDLTGIDFADLLLCQPSYCVFWVDSHSDTIEGDSVDIKIIRVFTAFYVTGKKAYLRRAGRDRGRSLAGSVAAHCDGHALVFLHEPFAKRVGNLCHGGGAVEVQRPAEHSGI